MNSPTDQGSQIAPCLSPNEEFAEEDIWREAESDEPQSNPPAPEDGESVFEQGFAESLPRPADSPFLEEALTLGSLGLRVLPVREASKKPRQRRWQDKATSDQRAIKKWPRGWRQGNLGMATGRGVIAVDVDRKNGGLETLKQLTAMHGPFPPTAEALTGSGGLHFLFRVPGNCVIGNKVNWERGIDIKGENGYIVVEPSIHPDTGKEYIWGQHPRQGIAEAPPWLLGKLPRQKARPRRRVTREASTASTEHGRPPGAWREGDHTRLLKEMKEKFPISGRGHRHLQMVRAVGSLVGREYEEGMIVGVMMDWWEFFYAQGLTGTDRPDMEAELAACLGSTRRNDKFAATRGDAWHRRRYRKIQLSEEQRQLMKARIVTDESGSRSLGTDSGRGPSPSPSPSLHTCKSVTQIDRCLCNSDDEAYFVEALIVHVTHKRLNINEVVIKMTDDQIRQIAAERRGEAWRPWDNKQMERLKSKYISRPEKPATRFELLAMIQAGQRSHAGHGGTPSQYESTGIERLLTPKARRNSVCTPTHAA
jgi:hypothetical protein